MRVPFHKPTRSIDFEITQQGEPTIKELDRSDVREGLFEIINNQIKDGNPSETKVTLDRLLASGLSKEEAMRSIAYVLLSEINAVLGEESSFNESRYVAALRALLTLELDS